MAHKAVFGIAESESHAERIVSDLQANGVAPGNLSVLFPDRGGSREFAHEHHTKAPEGTVAGASTGGVAGGALGLLAGIGALAVPGAGPFIAAGPIMATLSGAAIGATVGGIAGALIGLGIPEYEAKAYEEKIKGGDILIAVHTENAEQARRVKDVLKQADAGDIGASREASVKSEA